MRKGTLAPKKLISVAEKDLKGRGYVNSIVLGWVTPEELIEAGITKDTKAIPMEIVEDENGRKHKRVKTQFQNFMDNQLRRSMDKPTEERKLLAQELTHWLGDE